MKIHFIYPDVETYFYPGVHHGLAQIFSVLKSQGQLVSLHHVKAKPARNEILDVIQQEKPDLIGFTAMTNQIGYVDLWSKWIKQEFDIPIICGGIHATLQPEEIISFKGVDMICRGEGEYPLLELAQNWGTGTDNIKSLWVKKGSNVKKNDLRPLVSNLDELPYPDYNLFDCERILKDRRGDFAVLVSRGCPFSCSYCCNHALKNIQKGKYFRYRSVDNVLQQLELLTSKYPVRHISFADDIFGLVKDWVLEFCEKYPEKFELEFECNLRADTIDEELLRSLKSANCTQINMGIEAGNERLRKEILHRKMSNKQIIDAFDTAHKLGIKTRAYNMIGLPYETPEMIEETISLNKQVAPDQIAIFYFYPYPGTELYEICRKEGFLGSKHSASYVSESVLSLPTIGSRELERLYTKFYRYMITREIQSFHPFLRYPLKIANTVLGRFLGRNAIELVMKIYLKFFSFFRFLRRG